MCTHDPESGGLDKSPHELKRLGRKKRRHPVDRRRLELVRLRDEWALLARACQDVQRELTEFRIQYHARVGPCLIELERVKLQVVRLRTALEVLRRVPNITEEELQRWVDVRTREQAAEFDRMQKEILDDQDDPWLTQARPRLSEELRTELRRLYRRLAMKFHPDLQLDTEGKRACEVLMARINELYRAGDLEGLEILAQEHGHAFIPVQLEPSAFVAWLGSRIQRLRRRIQELRGQLDALSRSDLAVLRRRYLDAQQRGSDLFAELAAQVQADVAGQRAELEQLKEEGRTLSAVCLANIVE